MANLLITKSAFSKMLRLEMRKVRPDSDEYKWLFKFLSSLDEIFANGKSYSVPEKALADGTFEKALVTEQRQQRAREIAHKMGAAPVRFPSSVAQVPNASRKAAPGTRTAPAITIKRAGPPAFGPNKMLGSRADVDNALSRIAANVAKAKRQLNGSKI